MCDIETERKAILKKLTTAINKLEKAENEISISESPREAMTHFQKLKFNLWNRKEWNQLDYIYRAPLEERIDSLNLKSIESEIQGLQRAEDLRNEKIKEIDNEIKEQKRMRYIALNGHW